MAKLSFTAMAIAVALASLPHAARAAPYTYNGVNASYVFRQQVFFSAGTGQTVSTTNLSAGADTIVHVIDPSGIDIARNDDCGFGGLGSCVTFTAATAGYYTILVYAYSGSSGGTADVYKNGVLTFPGVAVGGTTIRGMASGANVQYETAFVNGGATDTMLWGFDCSGGPGKVIATNDDGGVGLGSQLVTGSSGPTMCKVLVGAYSASTAGPVNFYANDVSNDGDGDGLGAGLENELHTCDPWGSGYCSGVWNAQDTDRDGIPDAYEVFGKETFSYAPLYLPRWGASPRHKDVFVEADWFGQSTQPMTTTDAVNLAATYAVGSASDLKNPDGVAGVAIHVDLGVASTGTTYGNWGGANLANTSDYGAAPGDPANFSPNRIGIFHYQLYNVTAGGGQGYSPGDRYFIGGGVAAHELGHNLNLSHSGTPSTGSAPWVGGPVSFPGGRMDCKPQYSSLMSYSGASSAFSLGANPLVTNPSNVRELGNPFPGGDDSWLSAPPWIYPIDSTHTKVDWNRDGNFLDAAAGGERAMTTAGNYCTVSIQNMQPIDGPKLRAQATPKLLKLAGRLYAFWINASDHNIHYAQGVVSGADANGSCPGGSTLGATCMTFGADQTISAGFPVYAFAALAPNSSQVLFAVVDGAGTIHTRHSDSVDGSGNLTSFVTDPLEIAGTAGEPDLAKIYMDSIGTPSIGLFYRVSSGSFQWETTPAIGNPWTWRGIVTDTSGAALTGTLSPSVASTQNRTCGVFPDASSFLRFHCLDVSTNRWTDYTSSMFSSTSSAVAQQAKVGLAFHIPRDKNGAPVYGDASIGQFWLMSVASSTTPRSLLMYTSTMLSSTTVPSTSMRFNWWVWAGSYWDDVLPNTGVSLYEDPTVSALKGLLMSGVDGSGNSRPYLMPFVDGTINETQTDINDFQVMERGICLGTRASIAGEGDHTSFCGSINSFGY